MEIVSIDKLKPLEKVFPHHLENLEEMIEDVIYKPIIADRETGMIVDGSHRYAYFLKHGYRTVPVTWVNYLSDHIRVGTKLRHRFLIEDPDLTKGDCLDCVDKGELLPPRTTRHFLPFRKLDEPVPLDSLIKGEPQDISHLLADVDIEEEITHNVGYIAEIDEEIKVILDYLAETRETRRYLNRQVQEMKKTGLFVGKFNPPHIGHAKTILRLAKTYDLIVGVTGDTPENAPYTQDEVIAEIRELGIEVAGIDGVLTSKTDKSGLPEFDVLLSGNPEVLDWAKKQGIETKFIERSGVVNGTKIREYGNS